MTKLFSINKKDIIVALVVTIFMFGGRFIPVSETSLITSYGFQVIGIFIGLIIGWCLSGLFWPSILAIPALALTPYGDAATVISAAFNNSTIMMILLGFLCFAPMSYSGVGEILCNKLLSLKIFKGKPVVFMLSLMIGLFLLAGIGAITTPLIILIITLIGTMCKSLGYNKGEMFPAMFLTALIVAIGAGRCLFPFLGWPLMTVATLSRFGTISNTVFWAMVIPGTILIFGLYIVVMKLLRCNFAPLKEADLSGDPSKTTMNTYQKAVLISQLVIIAVIILSSFLGSKLPFLNSFGVVGCMGLGIVCSFLLKSDGQPLLDMKKAVMCVPLDMLFMFAIAILVSSILTAEGTGISPAIQAFVIPLMANTSGLMFVLILTIVTFILTNLLNNIVVVYTMLAVVGALFTANPTLNLTVTGTMITYMGILGFLLPSASVYGAILYGSEMVTPKSVLTAALLAMFVILLVAAVYMIPIGLML